MINPTETFTRSARRNFGRFVLLMLIFCTFFAGMQNAEAAAFNVNSAADVADANPGDGVCETAAGNGVCTLRAAVQEANAYAGLDTISLQASATYLLTQPTPLIVLESMNVVGAGASSTIIDGNNTVRTTDVFIIRNCLGGATCDGSHPANVVSISGLTIQHGGVADIGGGITNQGILSIDHCVLTQNKTLNFGGAIYNQGTLTISNSTISDNDAGASPGIGGGIHNSSSLTLKNSTVGGNKAVTGGGIFINNGTLVVINSTISGNYSSGNGGGIYAFSGTTSLFNATIAFNRANADNSGTEVGGGVYNSAASNLNLIDSIVSMNQVVIPMGQFPLLAPDDCAGTITSQGHNIVTNADPGHCTVAGAVLTGDPQLGLLQDNGGPTFTHALAVASPAIDAGSSSGCTDNFGATLTTDQRGVQRPSGAYCDIGAYESTETVFANGFEP